MGKLIPVFVFVFAATIVAQVLSFMIDNRINPNPQRFPLVGNRKVALRAATGSDDAEIQRRRITTTATTSLRGLKVAIVGGGPSGLLLAHRVLQAGGTVNLYERRPKPGSLVEQKRAYALGVGIRGRTAIQSVDMNLWKAIQSRGFASERFILHAGPLSVLLRDENDGKSSSSSEVSVEPSLLLYQSDLCQALVEEMESRWSSSGRLTLNFECDVRDLDLVSKRLVTTRSDSFDLLVGCDGVNSVVRKQISVIWPAFETTQELLPGVFKVVQLANMPPLLDPTAVQLLIPKSGAVTAFVEPTAKGRCCILLAGRSEGDMLLNSTNTTAIAQELEIRYPKLVGADLTSVADQLSQLGQPAQASRVTCNTYHWRNVAVLVGDAAHATGGVSGQGVNSALQDAAILANSLEQFYDASEKEKSLEATLFAYSQRAVPEGKALFDLSFGPTPSTVLGKLRFAFKSARDSLFKGRFGIGELPLQTLLTTSLKSFADIRRDRDAFYEVQFPNEASWNASIAALDARVPSLPVVS